MDKHLTFKLNSAAVRRAKQYAVRNNISLNRLVQEYFESLTIHENDGEYIEITPIVKSLSRLEGTDAKFAVAGDTYKKYIGRKYKN